MSIHEVAHAGDCCACCGSLHQHQVCKTTPCNAGEAPIISLRIAGTWWPSPGGTPANAGGQRGQAGGGLEAPRAKLQRLLCAEADPFANAASAGRCGQMMLPAWLSLRVHAQRYGQIASLLKQQQQQRGGIARMANKLQHCCRRWEWLKDPQDAQVCV